jgi:VWFA-related protein
MRGPRTSARAGSLVVIAGLLSGVAGAAAGAGAPHDAGRQAPTQTFRTRVELVTVDVNVIDHEGRPQRGLAVEDFQVTVDGKPRRVATVDFVDQQTTEVAAPPALAGATGDPQPITWSSNEGARTGRLYALIVDQANIQPGGIRAATEAATRFVQKLAATDRIALFSIPAGTTIDFTTDHRRVLDALWRVTVSGASLRGQHANVSVSEALAMQRIGSEACGGTRMPSEEPLNGILLRNGCLAGDPDVRTTCCLQVMNESVLVASTIQAASRQSLMSLENLLSRLAGIDGPKTVVLISQRLITGGQGRLEFSDQLKRLGRTAAAAHISVYVLHMSRAFVDANDPESGMASDTTFEDEAVARDGLDVLAGYARGTVLRVTSGADFAFERIQRETSAFYLLGFEAVAADRDGKPHQIRVRVGRRGVDVRARAEFVIAPSAGRDPEQRLADLLRTPGSVSLLPMRVATRVLPGTRADRLQLVVAADIGREAAPQKVAVGYLVTDEGGRPVTSGGESRLLQPGEGVFGDSSLRYAGAIELPPGRFRLKVAAVDEAGNGGTVEHAVDARLADAGPLVLGDVVLASAAASRLASGLAIDDTVVGPVARAYLQMRPREDIKGRMEAVAEVADTPAGRSIVSSALTVGPTETGLLVADGSIDLRLLPPGTYYARVAVSLDGRRLGSRTTPFLLAGSSASGAAAGRPLRGPGATLAIGADRLLLRSFDRRDVLRPDVAAYFVDRLAASQRGAASAAEARAAARAGDFERLPERLAGAGDAPLDAAFLRGLAHFAKGDLEPASREFRAALKIDTEFLPAIFYLGACYAAGGRDREAAGAWETALITESGARIVYEVLVDALLRLNDVAKAREILEEARGRWAGEEALVPRAAAVAAAGRDAKGALGLLAPYIDAHEGDAEAIFLAMRLIYQASADGRPLSSRTQDAASMSRYAAKYRAAKGQEREIVDRWLAFVEARR